MSVKVDYIEDITIQQINEEYDLTRDASIEDKVKNLIETALKPLAQGNEGYVKIENFELNFPNLKAKVLIRHKHVIKIRWDGSATLYAAKSYVIIDTNVIKPEASDLKVCVDTPVGQICITLADIFNTISGLY